MVIPWSFCGHSELSISSEKEESPKDPLKSIPDVSFDLDNDDKLGHSEANNGQLEGDILLKTTANLDLRVTTNLCIKCGKSFYDKRELKLHEVAIHKEKNIPCRICSKLFPSEKLRDKHKKTVHATDQAYQCDECPRNSQVPQLTWL